MKILVIEDNPTISSLIQSSLIENGYTVDCANNGHDGANSIENSRYDLIILDIMLPVHSGFELLPMISDYKIPVLILSALSSIEDKIKGYNLGVEDYITKPFELSELLMRIKVILRRHHRLEDTLVYNHVTIDVRRSTVTSSNTLVALTPKEYELLLFLIENRGLALSRDYLLSTLWGSDTVETRTLDIHIQRLRRKLGLESSIRTIFKFGYILDVSQ